MTRDLVVKVFWQPVSAEVLQVETSVLAERQALEMPCVAPSLVGRPHRHAYFQSSRVAQASNWGAPQVNSCCILQLCVGSAFLLQSGSHLRNSGASPNSAKFCTLPQEGVRTQPAQQQAIRAAHEPLSVNGIISAAGRRRVTEIRRLCAYHSPLEVQRQERMVLRPGTGHPEGLAGAGGERGPPDAALVPRPGQLLPGAHLRAPAAEPRGGRRLAPGARLQIGHLHDRPGHPGRAGHLQGSPRHHPPAPPHPHRWAFLKKAPPPATEWHLLLPSAALQVH